MTFDPTAVPEGLAQIQAAAAQSAAAHIADGGAPAPDAPAGGETPAPAAAPTEPAAEPATAAPPSPELSTTPSGPTSTPVEPTFDATSFDPDAQYGLKLEGWDGKSPVTLSLIQKLAARHREFNNRLAAPPKPADTAAAPTAAPPAGTEPTPPPITPAEPTAPAPPAAEVPTAEQFEAQIKEALKVDQVCENLVTEYIAADERIKAIDGEYAKISGDLDYHKRLAESPLVKGNPLEEESAQRSINTLELQKERLETERARLDLTRDRKADQYERRAAAIRGQQEHEISQRVTQTRRAQALKQNWTPAMERVFENNKISKALRPAIAKRVRDSFVASVNREETISELEGFMDGVVKSTVKEYDEHHRLQAADYATKAAERAAAGAAPATPGAAPPAATAQTTESPRDMADFYARHERERIARLGSGQR